MALFRLRTTGWGEGGNLNLASLFYGRPRRAAPTAKTQSWAEERPYARLCNARVPLITPLTPCNICELVTSTVQHPHLVSPAFVLCQRSFVLCQRS